MKTPISADCEPDSIVEDGRFLRHKLEAIDKLRQGLILEGVVLARGENFPNVFMPDERERYIALDASLTNRQRDVIEKWEMSELGVWPTGPLDWASFDDDEPQYRDMIEDLRSVGW